MKFLKFFISNRSYAKSNRITSIAFPVSRDALLFAKNVLKATDANERQSFGEKLLRELSLHATINPVTLKVSDTRQWHKKRNGRTVFKQYGYYRPKSRYIYIQNRTAVRGQVLAPKTFLDTLLHEWMHHYDTEALNIRSYHTKGFYARLTSLKVNLSLR